MKRLVVLLVAVAAMAGVAAIATAGDYHVGRLLICSDCHIAHGSQKHGYATDADTTWLGPHLADPPYAYLLRGETVNNACLNCHDGKSNIPDVLQAGTNPPTNGRSAGALNVPTGGAHGYASVAPYTQGDGHTLWSLDPAPGATASAPPIGAEGLECSDCHRVHGSKYFRNMMGDVATSTATYINPAWYGKEVTYEIGAAPSANPATVWVLEKTPHNYDNYNVQYLEQADQTTSGYGAWCGTCHGNFHGGPGSSNVEESPGVFKRHPTTGVDMVSGTPPAVFSSWKNTDPKHRLKVMDKAAAWDAGTSLDMTPSCFTCHKSHGNANKFGLIFVLPNASSSAPAGSDPSLIDPTRLATMTEEGDGGQYRDMCRNCHGMGRWPTGNPTNILP
jgi:cytochrome c553